VIGLEQLTAGLMGLDILIGIGIVVLAFMNWREFGESAYGHSFLAFGLGWVLILAHSVREFQYSLGTMEEFPILWAAGFSALGAVVLAGSHYLLYRDTKR
jgi:hypothetical protein